jgi:hypothetical protein
VLTQLLDDSDTGVRRLALRSAVGRPDRELRSRLRKVSTLDPDARLRAEAATMLREGADPCFSHDHVFARLLSWLGSTRSSRARRD